MPTYNNSKSQKRSKSQSKSGGRRKKQTMRKLRRGRKSRKVMRGGGTAPSNAKINEPMSKNFNIDDVRLFLTTNEIQIPENLNLNDATFMQVRKLVDDKYSDIITLAFQEKFPIS
jgi:hypothetical protein